MKIDPAGREYATWTITGDLSGITGWDVSTDGTTWTPLSQVGTTSSWRALVAGPSATSNPAGTLVLPPGRSLTRLRATGTPEMIYRNTGPIDVG